MPILDCKTLGNCAWNAIEQYSQISGMLHSPESFIQSSSAISINQECRDLVSLELPIRTLLYNWNIPAANLQGLGNFRVDLAVYDPVPEDGFIGLNSLVEFKLWTNRYHVARDINRLKVISHAINQLNQTKKPVKGYVVICPQYKQGLTAVKNAMKDFAQRFTICFEKISTITPINGITYGVGVAVINIEDCQNGDYG